MAYFDSAKNRVAWQRELEALRAERERRAKGGTARPQDIRQNSHRVRMTYKELEAEEYAAARAQKIERQKAFARTQEKKMESRQKENSKNSTGMGKAAYE